MSEAFLDGRVVLHAGDCRDVLRTLADASIDAVCTDPPYALVSIGKRYGAPDAAPTTQGVYARATAGFMGQQWDTGETAFAADFWREVFRVLKPGGHVLAFGGTRTVHRLTCAIEDAGFEIRDMVAYLYGSGFPKSHDVSKRLRDVRCSCDDPMRGVRQGSRNADGLVQESEIADVFSPVQWGAQGRGMGEAWAQGQRGAEDIQPDAGSKQPGMEGRRHLSKAARQLRERSLCEVPAGTCIDGEDRRVCDGTSPSDGEASGATADPNGVRPSSGPRPAQQQSRQSGTLAGQPEPQDGGTWPHCHRCCKPIIPDGLGTALKPALEPVTVARKPLIGTVAANVQAHGTGALNIDGCRISADWAADANARGWQGGNSKAANVVNFGAGGESRVSQPNDAGRWPANVIHDGSDEVVAGFPESTSPLPYVRKSGSASKQVYGQYDARDGEVNASFGDSGSAARFFKSVQPDIRCPLCDALIVPSSSSTRNIRTESFAPADAPVSPLRASGGKNRPRKNHANSAGGCSAQCRPPDDTFAPKSAQTWPLEKVVQNVLSAADLCGSCATDIARALVAVRLSGQQARSPSTFSIGGFRGTILSHSLASYVAGRESTDTILTTANLKTLFGCVFHAIAEHISSAKSEASTESAPKRLFYSSKADADDRIGSKHPTVKPVDLMRYLVRLVTPPGGTVLDPFAGTGTTGEAAYREGFRAVLIEREPQYQADIRRRMELVLAGPDERKRESIKASGKAQGHDDLPLFGGAS